MTHVNIEDVQRNLPNYLERVEAGETLVIVREGKPVAEVKPIPTRVEALRPVGLCAGEFLVPEGFDAPLPDDILVGFEGK